MVESQGSGVFKLRVVGRRLSYPALPPMRTVPSFLQCKGTKPPDNATWCTSHEVKKDAPYLDFSGAFVDVGLIYVCFLLDN